MFFPDACLEAPKGVSLFFSKSYFNFPSAAGYPSVNMENELEKVFGEEEKETPKVPEEPKETEEPEEKEKKPESETENGEIKEKEEKLINLGKAIEEANNELHRLRSEKKKLKNEEDVPKIDFEDPSAKAWDRHIGEKVNPVSQELERSKEEVRNAALKEFLADKPALRGERLNSFIQTYQRIKTATEMNKEGVISDLNKAFAAEFSDELIERARQARVDKAQQDALFSEPAVTRGATTYFKEKESRPVLSQEQKAILAKWGMSEDEWVSTKKEMDEKYA